MKRDQSYALLLTAGASLCPLNFGELRSTTKALFDLPSIIILTMLRQVFPQGGKAFSKISILYIDKLHNTLSVYLPKGGHTDFFSVPTLVKAWGERPLRAW